MRETTQADAAKSPSPAQNAAEEADALRALDAAGIGRFTHYPDEQRTVCDVRLRAMFGLTAGMTFVLTAAPTTVHPDDRRAFHDSVARALRADGDGVLRQDVRVVRPDGTLCWVHLRGRSCFADARAVRLDGVVIDIAERKLEETALRLSAGRQTFLVQLGDRLRPLGDADEIRRVATRELAEHLQVNRCYYAQVEEDGVHCVVRDGVSRGVPGFDARYRLDDYGPAKMHLLRTGQAFIMEDVTRDPEVDDAQRQRYLALRIRSLVNVPLLKDDRLAFVMGVADARARQWSSDEIELIHDVAERTWAAVERGRAESALRESDTRLQQIAHGINAGFYVLDAKQGRVVYANDAFQRLWGLDREAVHGDRGSWFARIHHDDLAGVLEGFQSLLDGADAFEVEYRLRTDDNGERWIRDRAGVVARDADGSVRTITGLADDITRERRAYELLRHSEEKYRNLFESIDEGFCLIEMIYRDGRPADYRFVEVNSAFERQTGLHDATGRTMREMAPGHEQHWFDIYGEVARTGTPTRFEQRAEMLGRDFDVYAFRVGPEGANRVAVLFADITERKRVEEVLRVADRRKDEFLATLAHELRNPLSPIRTGLELLRYQGLPDAAMPTVDMMETQVRHLVRLVDDLLDISRISRGKVELDRRRVDLADQVRAAADASRVVYERGGRTLTVELPPHPVPASADPTRITQVLGNLLSNAYKYTQAQGRVHVSLSVEDDQAVIRVRDDGIGIPGDELGRIFSMFVQIDTSLERTQSGLGLGLALARELVQMHGGQIEAESAGLGQGSQFTVRLPLDAPMPASTQGADDDGRPRATSTPSPAHRRVLVVDDNQASADSFALLLDMEGYDVRVAYGGREALRSARQWSPHAVLMDIGMPDLNGYETCRRMREDAAGRPFVAIAFTGWGQARDRERSRESGFDLHLVKPVDTKAVLELMGTLLSSDAAAHDEKVAGPVDG